jgi:hypothetical protein
MIYHYLCIPISVYLSTEVSPLKDLLPFDVWELEQYSFTSSKQRPGWSTQDKWWILWLYESSLLKLFVCAKKSEIRISLCEACKSYAKYYWFCFSLQFLCCQASWYSLIQKIGNKSTWSGVDPLQVPIRQKAGLADWQIHKWVGIQNWH